jgi:hypothetical protein
MRARARTVAPPSHLKPSLRTVARSNGCQDGKSPGEGVRRWSPWNPSPAPGAGSRMAVRVLGGVLVGPRSRGSESTWVGRRSLRKQVATPQYTQADDGPYAPDPKPVIGRVSEVRNEPVGEDARPDQEQDSNRDTQPEHPEPAAGLPS